VICWAGFGLFSFQDRSRFQKKGDFMKTKQMQLALLVTGLTCVLIVTSCMNVCTQNKDNLPPFTRFKLLDSRGNVVPPRPGAVFPEVISTNMLPRFLAASFIGYFEHGSNKEPSRMTVINYEDLYAITNEGDYTFIVQPVLFKSNRTNAAILDRVKSPSIRIKFRF
jgi:hypothetical protein